MFDLYWRVLGLPLSRVKGLVTDAVPFSLVEVSLWTGTAATLLLILSCLRPRGRIATRKFRRGALLAGPVFLIALGLGQGAFPFAIAPTALREPLPERLGSRSLTEEEFKTWAKGREAGLRGYLLSSANWGNFQALSEREVLQACDSSLDTVLAFFKLPPGRKVRAFKDMGPWTTAMGLLYGGPAFHDPFFGEIGIISLREYPVSHYWRLIAACHETAHAKGFTREMDAEILTQFALMRLPDPRFAALADIHFLRKTGIKIDWPDSLAAEARRTGAERQRLEASRPVLARVRAWMRRSNLQNSPVKYGVRTSAEPWNAKHPFFSTLYRAHPAAEEENPDAP